MNAQREIVLNERSFDGIVTWQVIRSADRGRLAIRGVVPPSTVPTVIQALSEGELRLLLEGPQHAPISDRWICATCRATNPPSARWCSTCSATEAA